MDKFVEHLKSEKIFTKRINSSDIPFHSPLMKVVAQDMIKKLKSVSGSQKLRSSRWISTSVPESQWSAPEGRYSSAEYFVNNLTSPVLFQEAIQLIPKDAIVIEISPDSMFKNVIRRSVGPDSTYVGLMKRKNSENSVIYLLSSIGELFNLGLKPKIEILYPRIQYPVRRGTQSLGSLIRWDHQDDWLVPLYPEYFNENSKSEIKIEIDLRKEENLFYFDHNTDGRVIFPTTGYLYVVWDEFARQVSTPREQLGVVFENVDILRAVFVTKNTCLEFKLNISRLNGEFQLYESDVLTVTGRVRRSEGTDTFLPLRQKLIRQTPGLSENNFRMSKEVCLSIEFNKYLIIC